MVLLLEEITAVWSLNHILEKANSIYEVELGNVEIACKNGTFNLKTMTYA